MLLFDQTDRVSWPSRCILINKIHCSSLGLCHQTDSEQRTFKVPYHLSPVEHKTMEEYIPESEANGYNRSSNTQAVTKMEGGL